MSKISKKLSAIQECVALSVYLSGGNVSQLSKQSGVSTDTIYRALRGEREMHTNAVYAICGCTQFGFDGVMRRVLEFRK